MWLIDQIAERHIAPAIEWGELDGLPGAGEPISLDDDTWVPEELRAGYRLLRPVSPAILRGKAIAGKWHTGLRRMFVRHQGATTWPLADPQGDCS
ncbi:MAG: DUF1992 domain-containing protein [Gammaproteobacteria bacterium]|jgi:hypothetical protein|nr:DUF1992 domain-containing protein [Gammaproteobacteria bacterium]